MTDADLQILLEKLRGRLETRNLHMAAAKQSQNLSSFNYYRGRHDEIIDIIEILEAQLNAGG